MKLNLILITSLLLLSTKCEENNKSLSFNDNYITIKQKLYPTPYVKEFMVTKDSLKLYLMNTKSDKDSLLISKKIDTVHLNKIKKVFSKLTDSIYVNKCISDGQVFDVEYYDNQILKKVRFSNVYNKSLDSAITFLNKNIKNKIIYDKKKIEALIADCE